MTTVLFDKASVMSIDGAEYLMLKLDGYSSRLNARKFTGEQMQKPYVAELKLYRQKRSLDANAYYFLLLGKLSEVLRIPTTELYRAHIKEIGGNFEIMPIREEAVERFISIWQCNGLGWVVDDLGKSKLDGYRNIKAYYGSSTYDSGQMSRLIQMVVDDCKEQGIETLTPAELERMMVEWDDEQNKGVTDKQQSET